MKGGGRSGASSAAGSNDNPASAVWTARFEGQFFKTKICSFWQKGQCMRGSSCKYAHGGNELNAMPDLSNTALCRQMLVYGQCNIPDCQFAHTPEALRATGNFYKTTMCSFHRYGRCSLGTRCRHAHSELELRRHPATALKAGQVRDLPREARQRQHSEERLGPLPSRRGDYATQDSDDEFGEPPMWQRHMSTPCQSSSNPMVFTAGRSSYEHPSWADLGDGGQCDSELSDIDEELDDVDDMWARMQTMPAGVGTASHRMPDFSSSAAGRSLERASALEHRQGKHDFECSTTQATGVVASSTWGTLPTCCSSPSSTPQQWSRQASLHALPAMSAPAPKPDDDAGEVAPTLGRQARTIPPMAVAGGPQVVMAPVQMVQVPMLVAMCPQQTALMKQLEVKLLEGAMPECYED